MSFYYHNSQFRNEKRILKLRKDYGLEGYAIAVMILEVLSNEKELKLVFEDIDVLEFDFHCETSLLKKVIFNSGLFKFDSTHFWVDKNLLLKNSSI